MRRANIDEEKIVYCEIMHSRDLQSEIGEWQVSEKGNFPLRSIYLPAKKYIKKKK